MAWANSLHMHFFSRFLSVAGLVWLVPSLATAGDGPRPRTPAEFGEVPCMAVVDRSIDPVFAIDYGVAHDEPVPTEDEVSDGRRLQFLGFKPPFTTLPLWISSDDLQAAEAVGLIDASKVPDTEVLSLSPDWPTDAWTRITPDDARLPITVATAEEDVLWDTTNAAPGTYVISGYTWDPPFNIHSLRWGAVKVVDSTSSEVDNLPATFIPPDPSGVLYAGEPTPIPGCVDALPGSVVRGSWAEVTYSADPIWHGFGEPTDVTSGPVTVEFVPPDPPTETTNFAIWIRFEVEDPLGRVALAQSPTGLLVLPNPQATTTTEQEPPTTETSGQEIPEHGCMCRVRPGTELEFLVWWMVFPVTAQAFSRRSRNRTNRP